MNIHIGADHRGVEYKEKVKTVLESNGFSVVDQGTNDPEVSCDYPKIAYKVATEVVNNDNDRGILICMSGIGQAMAANKVDGAFAALCLNTEMAKLSREHNNANVLVLSSKFIDEDELESMVVTWLTTEFEGGRHQKRVDLMKQIEEGKVLL